MVERIRDSTVAEALAAEAGTDQTPPFVLSEVITPVIFTVQRPPLAVSGYFPGTMGTSAAAVPLNNSHVGCFISGFGGAIGRINWCQIHNVTGGTRTYVLLRQDAPFVGFPSVRLTPGYVNAGNPSTGRAFSITKNDAASVSGDVMATFQVLDNERLEIPGPWIVNDGAIMVACTTVNVEVRVAFGYEVWNAIRTQPPGG